MSSVSPLASRNSGREKLSEQVKILHMVPSRLLMMILPISMSVPLRTVSRFVAVISSSGMADTSFAALSGGNSRAADPVKSPRKL